MSTLIHATPTRPIAHFISVLIMCALVLALALPAAAQSSGTVQSDIARMNELARPHGAPGGIYTVITVPPDTDIIGVRVYADENSRDRQIYGIKLRYQDPFTGEATWTAAMGSAAGKTFEFTPRAGERVNRINLWTRRNGPLAGVQVSTNVQGYGVFSRNFDGRRTIDIGRNREFGGLTARTDGRVLLGLGIIGFDPNNPWANTAWASNPPRGRSQQGTPRAPWETNPTPRVAADDRDPRLTNPTNTGGNTGQTPPTRLPATQPPTSQPPTVASAPPASTPADWQPVLGESIEAFGLHRFENRWKPDQRIDTPEGTSVITRVAPDGYWGAQWVLEPVEFCCFRIRNRWSGTYLVNTNGRGPVQLSADIEENDRRAVWAVEAVENESFVRIRNLYNDASLHIQNGELVAEGIRQNWHSAQWNLKNLDGTDILDVASAPGQNTKAGEGSGDPQPEVPNSQPPIALTIVHKGAFLVDMLVTFTEPGKLPAQILNERRVVVRNNQQVQIPYEARNNVKVKISAEGVARKFSLINRTISLDDGACILITGTIVTREAKQMTFEQCTR